MENKQELIKCFENICGEYLRGYKIMPSYSCIFFIHKTNLCFLIEISEESNTEKVSMKIKLTRDEFDNLNQFKGSQVISILLENKDVVEEIIRKNLSLFK